MWPGSMTKLLQISVGLLAVQHCCAVDTAQFKTSLKYPGTALQRNQLVHAAAAALKVSTEADVAADAGSLHFTTHRGSWMAPGVRCASSC